MASARKEQNTWPRIAASEEWKIGRVRITALNAPVQYGVGIAAFVAFPR